LLAYLFCCCLSFVVKVVRHRGGDMYADLPNIGLILTNEWLQIPPKDDGPQEDPSCQCQHDI